MAASMCAVSARIACGLWANSCRGVTAAIYSRPRPASGTCAAEVQDRACGPAVFGLSVKRTKKAESSDVRFPIDFGLFYPALSIIWTLSGRSTTQERLAKWGLSVMPVRVSRETKGAGYRKLASQDRPVHFAHVVQTLIGFPNPAVPGMSLFMRGYFSGALVDALTDANQRVAEERTLIPAPGGAPPGSSPQAR